ncbi:MAG: hypothetical protein WB567_23045, partial [Terracidiphilus sp.]
MSDNVNAGSAAIDLADRIPFWGQVLKRTADGAGERNAATIGPDLLPLSKVPEVLFGFWVIKIAATTLGEVGGDALSMSMKLGYATSTMIFFVLFAAAVTAQIRAKRFHSFLYWAVIVATTLTGTTMA